MSQTNVDFSQNPSGAQLMDDFLAKMQENILTSNSGLQRPEYAQEGIVWLDKTTTPWTYKFFDGTDDIIIGQFDVENNKFIPSDPMTTAGDLIVEGEDGNPTRLAPGIAGTVLTSNGAGKLPSYQKSDYQLVSNLEQTLSESTDKYPSSKLVNDEFSKRKLKGIEGYRSIAVNGNTTISLQATDEILDIPITANSTITFDLSSVAMPSYSFYTVQLKLRPYGKLTISLKVAGLQDSAPVCWVNGNIADLSDGKAHWLVLRTYDGKGYALWSDAGTEG